MMHQGKFKGLWKKAYFVLKDCWLFQYEKETVRRARAHFFKAFSRVARGCSTIARAPPV